MDKHFLNLYTLTVQWYTNTSETPNSPLQLGLVTKCLLRLFYMYIMGFSLKNARNGKSISKIECVNCHAIENKIKIHAVDKVKKCDHR